MAKDIRQVEKVIIWLGFNLTNGQWRFKAYAQTLITCFLIINSSIFVVNKWEDVGKRLDGVKGLVFHIMCSLYFLALTCNWDNLMLLIGIIDKGLYNLTFQSCKKESELRKSIGIGIMQLNTIWFYGLMGYTTLASVTPVIIFIFRLIQYKINDITIDLLYTSVPFYFPKSFENIPVYVLAITMQSWFLLYGTLTGYVVIVSAFNSMQLIEGELKLLKLSLHAFDSTDIATDESDVKKCCTTRYIWPSDGNCRSFLRYFVKHHYNIYRKVNDVTKGIQLVAFSINSGMSVLLCTSIYSIAKRKEILVVTQEAIFGGFVAFCLYCYNLMGEKILTQDEHLRKALYESEWIDKPQWFKRSLQIIMARTNRPVEMKLVGLFVLNLNNFLLTVRAAYSYYNVLSNL